MNIVILNIVMSHARNGPVKSTLQAQTYIAQADPYIIITLIISRENCLKDERCAFLWDILAGTC